MSQQNEKFGFQSEEEKCSAPLEFSLKPNFGKPGTVGVVGGNQAFFGGRDVLFWTAMVSRRHPSVCSPVTSQFWSFFVRAPRSHRRCFWFFLTTPWLDTFGKCGSRVLWHASLVFLCTLSRLDTTNLQFLLGVFLPILSSENPNCSQVKPSSMRRQDSFKAAFPSGFCSGF